MSVKFVYSSKDFVWKTAWDTTASHCDSKFDNLLKSAWLRAVECGYFRYRLDIRHSKILPGKLSLYAQLNTDRARNRRPAEEITSLTQPFDHQKFNFMQIGEKEMLFELKRETDTTDDEHLIIINVSPIEFGHSLLLPFRSNCLPQLTTAESIQLAIEITLLSSNPAFRGGFNSLCGYASVNHLHYHVYYLNQVMLLETIPLTQLGGPCYELVDYPAKGFVFQLIEGSNPEQTARDIYKLTSYLQQSDIAHNVYITRAKRLTSCYCDPNVRDSVRVYVWARKSSAGAKESSAFNPALCELFGHLSIKTEAAYESITEAEVGKILNDICEEPFMQMREAVKQMFSL